MVYSYDLRQRVINYYNKSHGSIRLVSSIFDIPKTTIWRWIKYGIEINKPIIKPKYSIIKQWLNDTLIGNVTYRLKDLASKIHQRFKIKFSNSTIYRYIKQLGFSYKKCRPKVITNNNTELDKSLFRQKVRQLGYDKVLCFDEVGFNLCLRPKRGWSLKGSRCICNTRQRGHIHITGSFLIGIKGVIYWQLSDKAMDKNGMLELLDKLPVDETFNHTMILDNLRVHRSHDVVNKIKSVGITPLWTLGYTPELNAIEEVFGWIKTKLRHKIIHSKSSLEHNITELVREINNRGLISYYNRSYGN